MPPTQTGQLLASLFLKTNALYPQPPFQNLWNFAVMPMETSYSPVQHSLPHPLLLLFINDDVTVRRAQSGSALGILPVSTSWTAGRQTRWMMSSWKSMDKHRIFFMAHALSPPSLLKNLDIYKNCYACLLCKLFVLTMSFQKTN